MSATIENMYPTIGGLICMLAMVIVLNMPIFFQWRTPLLQGIATLLPAALNISAIAIGFLATSQAILLSLNRSNVIRLMKASGHYNRLHSFLRRAITTSFLWAILSALLSTFHLLIGGLWRLGTVCLWTYFCCCSIFCYHRATTILAEVMKNEDVTPSKPLAPEWNPDEN